MIQRALFTRHVLNFVVFVAPLLCEQAIAVFSVRCAIRTFGGPGDGPVAQDFERPSNLLELLVSHLDHFYFLSASGLNPTASNQ